MTDTRSGKLPKIIGKSRAARIERLAAVVIECGLARFVTSADVLSGGVSGTVLKVDTDAGPFVVKSPRRRLAVSAPWLASRARARSEAAGLRLAHSILGDAIPEVLFVDERRLIVVTRYADRFPQTWKHELMSGVDRQGVAEAVARMLARLHAQTMSLHTGLLMDRSNFIELRIEPYFRVTARRDPNLALLMQTVEEDLLMTQQCLVHGDFSPKNLLVSATDPPRAALIDFEVAHIGNPGFDLGFILSHLLLKSVAGKVDGRRIAKRLLACYEHAGGPADTGPRLTRLVAALMLARVKGWSPVEYLDDQSRARAVDTALALVGSSTDFAAALTSALEP